MDANRFFSVPYDNRNDTRILRLRRREGGIAAYGRWVSLLGMLYDEHGLLDLNDEDTRWMVSRELELEDVDGYMESLASVGLIDMELWSVFRHVVNDGVCDEIEYRRAKSEAGKKGTAKRWSKEKK